MMEILVPLFFGGLILYFGITMLGLLQDESVPKWLRGRLRVFKPPVYDISEESARLLAAVVGAVALVAGMITVAVSLVSFVSSVVDLLNG